MMNNDQPEFHKLEDIANWQLKQEKVGLPPLQRGYVWKPKQVETLWDSLLRGFPIGSFLVSENKSPEFKKDLLDGQQRATAIAMGFYNPWEEIKQHPKFYSSKFKNIKETVPVLWLDIAAREEEEKGDFIFLPRLITQSHPWGFNHNSTPLGIASRTEANKQFKKNESQYPHYNLKDVYPWYAELPVPLVFLIDAMNESTENWKERVIGKSIEHLSHITADYKNNTGEATTYIKKLQETLNDKSIYKKIEESIKTLIQTRIPIITLTNKHLVEESNSVIQDAATLFVRINTSGTPLNGEELIYTMYKTVFSKSKEIVEAAGADFIAPSRVITLISRIVLTDISRRKKEFKFSNQLKLKQFKNAIKDESDFYIEMKQFAEDEESLKLLFNNAKSILIGEKDFQLPVPLAVDIARGNADVLFILLYWIHISKINVDNILKDETFHKKILAAITTLNWFVFDTPRFLSELAKHELESGNMEFWNSNLFTKQKEDDRWITDMPKPNELKEILNQKFGIKWEDMTSLKKALFDQFRSKLFEQRGLLLFVQRAYINERFKELQWDTLLEDINRPWDWDHIYPSVYNQKGTYAEVRELNYSIGNLRAWALVDNRRDQANLPKDKFGELEKIQSFIEENDWIFWKEIDSERITINENKAKNVCLAIYTRIVNIYKTWYNTLGIDKLVDC